MLDRPYVIAETAMHHEGDIEYLKELILLSKASDADAVKFHMLFDLDSYFVKDHPAYEIVLGWLFSKEEWKAIIEYAHELELDVVVLCNDVESVNWIFKENIDIQGIEVHASSMNDIHLLNAAKEFEGNIILGIGGCSVDEIEHSIGVLKSGNSDNIILMYGFQNYPTKYEDVNFGKMNRFQGIFSLPMGYADHSDPKDPYNELISVMPSSFGVFLIEKHLTLEVPKTKTDAHAAVNSNQFKSIKKMLDVTFLAYGDSNLLMNKGEKKYGRIGIMKKAIVANVDIRKGQILTSDLMTFKRTIQESFVEQTSYSEFIGKVANQDILEDNLIGFDDLIDSSELEIGIDLESKGKK